MFTHIDTHMCTNTDVHTYVYTCLCICALIFYIYIYIFIHNPPNSKVWGSLLEKGNAPGWMGGTRMGAGGPARIGAGWVARRGGGSVARRGLSAGPRWAPTERAQEKDRWAPTPSAGPDTKSAGSRHKEGVPGPDKDRLGRHKEGRAPTERAP